MKNISLISRKWLQGGGALFALYVAMQAGGIVVRLGLLAVATVCSALWWKSKQALDATQEPISVPKQAVEEIIVLPSFERPAEPSVHFVKSPVRRPKPVYIHRGGFRLYPH